jgi:hypothetical protein
VFGGAQPRRLGKTGKRVSLEKTLGDPIGFHKRRASAGIDSLRGIERPEENR